MWKPPQRIKYASEPGAWPTTEQALRAQLYQPLDMGTLQLEERTWVPAMVPWRATEQGEVTDNVLAWYERFASGQPGAIVVEATGIRDIPSGPLLRIGDDRFIPGLEELVQTVHRASDGRTRLLIQIIDFLAVRRRPDPQKYFARYWRVDDRHRQALDMADAPEEEIRSAVAALDRAALENLLDERELESLDRGYRERVTDVHLPHIEDLPRVLPALFAAAAGRAQQAGFDGVELHYAHAYTMASFLSRLNDRSDGYGGSVEHRVRLASEVLGATRQRVGDDYCIGARLLSEDCIDGGSTLDDVAYFSTTLAEQGMDFLSYSRGGKFEDAKQPKPGWAVYPYTGPSGYECMPAYLSDEQGPFGRNVEPTAHIKQALLQAGHSTPVVVAGGIHGFEQAEAILQSGAADIIGAARQSMADPDWFRKVRLGCGDQVRTCEYTNYCEGLDQKHKQVTCQLWDRLEMDDPRASKTPDGKRRLTAPAWRRT